MSKDKTIKVEDVKLNQLNMSSDDKNLKLAPGVLSSFMSGQIDIRDFGISDPDAYTDYGVKFSRFSDPDMDRALNQSNSQQFFRALGRIGLEGAVGEAVAGVGSLAELLMMPFEEGETDFENAVTRLGEDIKEAARESMPIYRENPEQHFNMADFAWWADNSVSVGSTLGLLIPATGMVKGVSMFGKAMSTLGKSGKFAKGLSKALRIYDRTGDATKYWGKVMGTSMGMRHAENFGESLQTYNTVKAESSALFNNMSDEEFNSWKSANPETVEGSDSEDREGVANHIANKAGWHTYKMDAVNLAFDMVQVMPLFKGFKYNTRTRINPSKITKAHYASMGKDMTKQVARKAFTQRLGKAITTGTIAQQLTEGIEEAVNAISQQEGTTYGKQLLGTANDANFGKRMGKYLRDPSTWEQAFWGVMGGVAFSGGVSGINKARNLINGIPADRADKLRLAEIEGRKTELSKAAVLLHQVDNNINPYTGQAFEGTKEQIEQESGIVRENIVKDISLQLGISAAKHGNVNLLIEQLESENFKKEIVDTYKLSDEAGVNDIVKTIKEQALKAESLYKQYYNKFATEDISQPIKDLLITDAIWLEQNRNHIEANTAITANKISNLKNQTDYITLSDRINKANEGKGVEEAIDLNDSITYAAIQELRSQVLTDLSSTDNPDNKEALTTRLKKYKYKLDAKLKELGEHYEVNDLIKGGLDYAIVEYEAENLLNELMLDDNSTEFKELLGDPKKKAKEHEADMKLAAKKDAEKNVPEIDKYIDEADTPKKLDAISKRISELINENQLAKDIYNPLKIKADKKSTELKRTAKRRESAIKEKDNYIKALRKSAGTFNINNVINKRKNIKFTQQFTDEDLVEIDAVIEEVRKTKPKINKKKADDGEIKETLVEEFSRFIGMIQATRIDALPVLQNIKDQGKTNDIIKLTAEDFAKYETFKSLAEASTKVFDKFKSLGEVYNNQLAQHNNFNKTFNDSLQGKTVVNIDTYVEPKVDSKTTEETITNDELVNDINKIANDYNVDNTQKAEVVEGNNNVDRVKQSQDKLNHAVRTIRLLALQDAGLGRSDELVNANYSFNNVLEFIYNNMEQSLLLNPTFIDTLRMVYNINVNDGTISKPNYVNEGFDMDAFLRSMTTPDVSITDTDVFLSQVDSNTEALSTVMGTEAGDTVEVSVDEEQSGNRATDVLQADIKITRKGVVIGHLNRIYNTRTTPTMFNGNMPYIVGDNWTDRIIAEIMNGGFRKEFDLLIALHQIKEKSKAFNTKAFGYIIDENGLDLLDSTALLEAINMNRDKPINRTDNRAEFDKALLHIANIFTDYNVGSSFSAGSVTDSLNKWNDRVKANITNGLAIRNKMKDGAISIPVASKTGGSILKAPEVNGKPSFNNVSEVFGNPDDLVLLHTASNSSTELITVNGRSTDGFDGEFRKGTIYTIAKTNDPLGTPVFLHTTDIVDTKTSKVGNEYGKQLVKYATGSIIKLVNAKGEYSVNDFNTMVTELGNLILGLDKNTSTKKDAISFRDKQGNLNTITISKTVTSIYINGKRTYNSNDSKDFAKDLATVFESGKRNVPIAKDVNGEQTMPQSNTADGKYKDYVTSTVYPSFTHYAVATELLVTQNTAIKDSKGNIVSHINPKSISITVDGNNSEVVKKAKPPVEPKVTIVTDTVNDTKSPYADLFKMAKESGAEFTNEVIDDNTYFAEFNLSTKKISITTRFSELSPEQQPKVLAHEAIHAVVYGKITDDQGDKLDAIHSQLEKAFNDGTLVIPKGISKDHIGKILKSMVDKNGYLIPSEMLTYAFTDGAFAATLNANKSDVNTKESLWDKFVALVAELLPNTKLTEVRAIMNEVMGITEEVVVDEVKDSDTSEFQDLSDESLPNDDFGNGELFTKVVNGGNNDLGSNVATYMRGKSKAERDFMRNEINNGNIVLKCK